MESINIIYLARPHSDCWPMHSMSYCLLSMPLLNFFSLNSPNVLRIISLDRLEGVSISHAELMKPMCHNFYHIFQCGNQNP